MAVGCAYLCISAANLKEQGLVLRLLEGNRKHLKPFGTKLQPESSSYCNPDAGMYMSGWRDLQREGQVRTCSNIVTFMRIHSHTSSLSHTCSCVERHDIVIVQCPWTPPERLHPTGECALYCRARESALTEGTRTPTLGLTMCGCFAQTVILVLSILPASQAA